jgi:hypothetical protein
MVKIIGAIVENCGKAQGIRSTHETLTACSACAGDYQDPDRTAWNQDEDDLSDDSSEPEEIPPGSGSETNG